MKDMNWDKIGYEGYLLDTAAAPAPIVAAVAPALIIYCNKTQTLSSASTVVAQWFKLLPIIHKVLGSIPVRYIFESDGLIPLYPCGISYFLLNRTGGEHFHNFYPIISRVYHALSLVSSGANIFTNYIL